MVPIDHRDHPVLHLSRWWEPGPTPVQHPGAYQKQRPAQYGQEHHRTGGKGHRDQKQQVQSRLIGYRIPSPQKQPYNQHHQRQAQHTQAMVPRPLHPTPVAHPPDEQETGGQNGKRTNQRSNCPQPSPKGQSPGNANAIDYTNAVDQPLQDTKGPTPFFNCINSLPQGYTNRAGITRG